MPVRVARTREVRPGGHELVRKIQLPCVERMLDSTRSAMPEREQMVDIGGVVGEGDEPGHLREVERRSPVIKFINIDRDLGRQNFIEYPLATYCRVCPDPIVGQFRGRVGAQRVEGQNRRSGPSRVRRCSIGRIDVVYVLRRSRWCAKRVVRVGVVFGNGQEEGMFVLRIAVDQGHMVELAVGKKRHRLTRYDLSVYDALAADEITLSCYRFHLR